MKSEYRRPDPVIYAERVLDGLPYQDLESNIWIFLEEVTGKKKFDLINLFQNENFCLSQQEFNLFKKMLERRKNHEPVAYIIGKKNFYGYDFKTGPGVLIPRFETELLVERVGKICDNKKILDLCSGSGCIGITLVKEFNPESVCCSDISEKALNYIKNNAESILNSNEQRKVTIVKSDMFENLK
ncbi:MAG: HemK/PrmC family methyltransferase, partial [Candidatus Muiribacteriota bacterium]